MKVVYKASISQNKDLLILIFQIKNLKIKQAYSKDNTLLKYKNKILLIAKSIWDLKNQQATVKKI